MKEAHRRVLNFIILSLYVYGLNADDNSFCTEYVPNIDFDDLPELSREFQTNIQLGLPNKRKVDEVIMLYDRYDFRAELITDENFNGRGELDRLIFYYNLNEQLIIGAEEKTCEVKKLDEVNPTELFFGLTNYTVQGGQVVKNMLLPEEILHFRQPEFKFFKSPDEVFIRGIPVDHYKSCQNWPLLKSEYHIDFFFTKPDFKQGVAFNNEPVPVAAYVTGRRRDNRNRTIIVQNEYNFFRFRPAVTKRKDLFSQPEGYYCMRQTDKRPIPQVPFQYSMVDETLFLHNNQGMSSRFSYAYSSQIVMWEKFDQFEEKTVHDYFSGIEYVINEEKGTCKMGPIPTDETNDKAVFIEKGLGVNIALKQPNQTFYIDDSYFYAGQRYERGKLCDVFVSLRHDYAMPGLDTQPFYWIFEIYFLNIQETDNGIDNFEPVVPVTLKISTPIPGYSDKKIVKHFYDLDSTIKTAAVFDITTCFESNQKTEFGIQYDYPKNLTNGTADALTASKFKYFFELKVIEQFYEVLIFALENYNFSPFRIVPPKVVAYEDYFVLYTGFTDRAPDIYHFTKTNQSYCNVENAKTKFKSTSAEKCAQVCLDADIIVNQKYACQSFDYCAEKQMCAFYNWSHTTDPELVPENPSVDTACDHYSKTVDHADAVSKTEVHRLVEDLVLRGEFDLPIRNENDPEILVVSFKAVDTFLGKYIPEVNLEQSKDGITSFFDEFGTKREGIDFDVEKITNNNTLFLRQRQSISIDECAKLCMEENTFICESLSYSSYKRECKWSSLFIDDIGTDLDFLTGRTGFDLFNRDKLYKYVLFEKQVTSNQDNEYTEVNSVNECAEKCETSIKPCRSFNFCKRGGQLLCETSGNHINSTDQNSNTIYSSLCDHYSRKVFYDFQLVPELQLSRKPQNTYFDISVEKCALLCLETESYVCRSFDFIGDSCLLYEENLNDIDYDGKVEGIENVESNHYSRLYFTQNGAEVSVTGRIKFNHHKYSGGKIFIITAVVAIVCIAIGAGLTFITLKFWFKKEVPLPTMEFINPNYKK